jgi:hypothetical protein
MPPQLTEYVGRGGGGEVKQKYNFTKSQKQGCPLSSVPATYESEGRLLIILFFSDKPF